MGLKAKKAALKAAQWRVSQLRPSPPVVPPPSREFRPITPDPYRVRIPKVRKLRSHARVAEPSTRILLVLPIREKRELTKVAEELGVSVNTVLRLSYKRFLRMPELPLSPSQVRVWQLGIQRDRKAVFRKINQQLRNDLLDALDRRDRLSTEHLEHKAIEVVATNGYRKTKRMYFKKGARIRAGKVGNPHGYNGRATGVVDDAVSSSDRHPPDRGGTPTNSGIGNPVPARPVRPVPTPKRLMVRPR